MKRIISLFLIFVMISMCANAQALYWREKEEIVTGGIKLKNIQRFYGDYALNINCITVDLKNKNLSLELLKHSDGIDKTQTVMDFAKNEEDVVVAMNADFFSAYKNDQNFSLGIEVKDGKLLQSHINANMAAGLLKDNSLLLSYFALDSEITAQNGEKMAVTHINKPTDYYGALLMYTADFNGGVSPFFPEGISVVTIQDGKVTAKGISLGGTVSIPDNGYILAINDSMTPFLEHNFNVGDEVAFKLEANPTLDDVKTAFGGGTLLLENGKKTPITHTVNGNNPRSVIGTNNDGTLIYMITVDGRQTVSRGASLDALADICLELGVENAMNLDGGGSTALVGKTLNNENLHFINSPSENRKVINALAVTSKAESLDAVGFIAEAESENVLSGDSVELKITPYDENYNVPEKITGTPKWVVPKGRGYVRDNVYYAQGSGETVLQLYYDGKKTDECIVNVIDSVSGIVAQEQINLNVGEKISASGLVEVFDAEGNTAKVRDITLLNPEYDKNFISVDGKNITAKKTGGAPLKLSRGKAERSIKVICGKYEADAQSAVTDDPLCKKRNEGLRVNVLGAGKATNLLDRIVYARAMDIFRNADARAVLGDGEITDITPASINLITGSAWGEYSHGNSKIISLKLSSEGKMQRGQQWKDLAAALVKDGSKNIIILADSAPRFVSDLDEEAFSGMLSQSSKDKKVFVVYNGDENFCRIKDGVRYITLADTKDESMIHKVIENTKYLSFNITEDEITYCFESLYE